MAFILAMPSSVCSTDQRKVDVDEAWRGLVSVHRIELELRRWRLAPGDWLLGPRTLKAPLSLQRQNFNFAAFDHTTVHSSYIWVLLRLCIHLHGDSMAQQRSSCLIQKRRGSPRLAPTTRPSDLPTLPLSFHLSLDSY